MDRFRILFKDTGATSNLGHMSRSGRQRFQQIPTIPTRDCLPVYVFFFGSIKRDIDEMLKPVKRKTTVIFSCVDYTIFLAFRQDISIKRSNLFYIILIKKAIQCCILLFISKLVSLWSLLIVRCISGRDYYYYYYYKFSP